MKKRDPARMAPSMSAEQNIYPEPSNAMPNKRSKSLATDPSVGVSNRYYEANREMAAEERQMRTFFYNNVDPRRKQELRDANMIQEDHNSIANLSETAIHQTWNANEYPERLAMYNQSTCTKR